MASELKISAPSGLTLKAVLVSFSGLFANGTALEAFNAGHWTTYGIVMTEIGSTGVYEGNMPAVAAGYYSAFYYRQAAGTFVISDAPAIAKDDFSGQYWTGSAFVAASQLSVATTIDNKTILTAGTGAGQLSVTAGAGWANVVDAFTQSIAGQAQAGGTSTITLASNISGGDNFCVNRPIYIVGGTGTGQFAVITAYSHTTKVATVHQPWTTVPDASSVYDILALPAPDNTNIAAAAGSAATAATEASVAAAGTVSIASTLAAMPAVVWNTLNSTLTTAGSIGAALAGRLADLLNMLTGAGTGAPQFTPSALSNAPAPTFTPLASTVSAGEVISADIIAYLGSAPPYTFIVVDVNKTPIDLSGKSLVFVAAPKGSPSPPTFSSANGAPTVTLGGAGNNEVTVTFSPANTTPAEGLSYTLWNATDNRVLAKGRLLVQEVPQLT